MIVLLDAGNSRFKWTYLENGPLTNVFAQGYDSQDRAQAVVAAIETTYNPQRIVIASVLGDAFKERLTRLIEVRFAIETEFVVPKAMGHGVRVAYTRPEEFGADRFATLVAAHRYARRPCIVVDCGTAVTIDALTADGQHLGGLILPGLELMRRSLIEHTARISISLASSNNNTLFGRTTSHGVCAGTLHALVGAIDRIVDDMIAYIIENRGVNPVECVMTGGGGAYMVGHLTARYRLEPWLVLQGLAIIARSKRD